MPAANIANIQLWAKKDGDTEYTRIDLFPEEPIKLNLAVSDIIDPLATNSIFSRTFRVPNTQPNNAFFKAVFNVNSVSFNASKKVSAYLNDSGSFYTSGNIRLMSTYQNDKDGDVQYEVVFMGETSDFGGQIGGGFLSDVNLTEYNHDQTYLNIVNSWNTNTAGVANGLFNGDVVYPLCNWGYTYSGGLPVQNTTALYTGTTGGLSGFTDMGHPLSQSQMKPSIRAKALWDKIFAETEYTYDSVFIESDFFKKLYIISEKAARPQLNVDLTFNASNTAPQSFNQVIPTAGAQLTAPFEISDPNGVWNGGTSTYTAQATSGTSYIFIATYFDRVFPGNIFTPKIMVYTVSLRNAVTNAVIAQQVRSASNLAPLAKSVAFTVALTAGDKVIFTIEPSPVSPATTGAGITITDLQLFQTSGPELVTLNSVMPDNIRKIDFMRSIINRFKLVFVPSADNRKHFTITPWKDWILEGSTYDWNYLIDSSKDIKSTPLFYGQNRFQIYADQEDADFPNYTYQLSYKQTYGQLNLDSDNELLVGATTVKDQFAPTPIFPIGGAVAGAVGNPGLAAKFLIPWISKADFTAVQNNPIQPKLRLVFYNGKISAPLTWYLEDDSGGGLGPYPPAAQTVYPLMSEYSYWPVDTASFDLSWQNIPPLYNVEEALNPPARTNYDTFNVYWKTWYDTNFDPYSRKVELTLVLDYVQMLTVKFNNYYFIKDAWYLINKITDYIAGQTTPCKVELIKVGNGIGLTIPPIGGQGYPHGLCYTNPTIFDVSFCTAYCCAQTGLTGLYYTNNVVLASSTIVWQDEFKTNPANPGFYASAGGTVFEVGNGGYITEFFNGAECEPCVGPELTSFPNCCGSSTLCGSCCCADGIINLWGDGATLDSSFNVYTNSIGTTTPNNGWYTDPDNPGFAVQIEGGEVWSIGVCSTCECAPTTPLFERNAYYGNLDDVICDICTIGNTLTTIWLDTDDWSTATTIYSSSSTETPVGEGYWRNPDDSSQLYETDASGAIIGTESCAACTAIYYYQTANCRVPELIQYFSSTVPVAVGQVVSSALFPGQCWSVTGDTATSPYPLDVIHDNCESCLETWICNCVEYQVETFTKYPGYISYTDCTDGTLQFQEIIPGSTYNICMCEGSAGVVEGNLTIVPIGTCVTPPCYVWNLVVDAGPDATIEYEECTTGLTKSITIDAGGEYQVCAVDGTVTVISGSATITQGPLCG